MGRKSWIDHKIRKSILLLLKQKLNDRKPFLWKCLKLFDYFSTIYLWCSLSCFSTVIFNIRFLVLIILIPIWMIRVRGAFSKYFIDSSKPSRSSKSALALQPSRLVDRQKTVSWPCARVTCGGFVWWCSPTVGLLNRLKSVQDSCPGTKYQECLKINNYIYLLLPIQIN